MVNSLKAVVLAAGKGTRLQTDGEDAPKVMREVCGKPLLYYVLNALEFIRKEDTIVIVGYKKEAITRYFNDYVLAEQKEQLGTGHAVMSAEKELQGFEGSVLVCSGDMPAVRRETYQALVSAHFASGGDCMILTGESSVSLSYGRIVRSDSDEFLMVVEEKDCTPSQLDITELNSGIYIFRVQPLLDALKKLGRENAQGEYYLTDVPRIMAEDGCRVGLFKRDLGDEIVGVNTPVQLKAMESIISNRTKHI